MDKFLQSGFGETSIVMGTDMSMPKYGGTGSIGPGGGGGSNLMSYMNSQSQSIRPSVSFMSMKRDEYKQTKYNDEQDGPSPLQILGNEKAFKDKNIGFKTYYEKDRESHLDSIQPNVNKLQEAKQLLYNKTSDDPATASASIISPKQRRGEIIKIRQNLDQFHNFKKTHMALGHRERNIKGGWRHGITGLENADSENISVMFKEQKE